jgi:D-arabinose 1-dehydrogenase-like Zn-dependent alcohol dehydrogenase
MSTAGIFAGRTRTEVFPLQEANVVLQRLKAGAIKGAAVLQVVGT